MKTYGTWLLRLYPQAWRARYEEEFLALLDACPFSLWTIWDVCLGAIDARLHFTDVTGRMLPFMNRLRAASITVFCAYISLVVAGLAYGKMVEYDDFQNLINNDPQVRFSYYALYTGAIIALLAVLVGGLPIAWAAARYAYANRRWRLLSLFAVPPVSFVIWMGYTLIAVSRMADNHVPRPLPERLLLPGAFIGLFLLAAIASTAAVSIIVQRSQVSEKLFRFARIPAVITTLGMALVLVSIIFWGIATRAADPALFSENNGILATNTTLSWVGIIVAMALAVAIAAFALIRGLRRPGDTSVTPTLAGQAGM